MKIKWCLAGFLAVVLCAGVQLNAQQAGAVTESFEVAKAKAEQGIAESQKQLGVMYENGQGVATNFVEAVKWYRKAAEQGIAEAQSRLGFCYDKGQGVTQDYGEAVKWYRNAADLGLSEAQFNLGVCYGKGQSVTQDYGEAVKWYRKATDQGLSVAQFNLGVCYDKGQGVTQDYAEAVKWYRKATDQGLSVAQFNLGDCFFNGRGVTQDYAEAVKWYRKAADQGDSKSQFMLGICYGSGEGVPQNDLQAYIWSSLAAAQGEKNAANNRDIFAILLSREELSEGQRRAAAFVPRDEKAGSSSDNPTSPETPNITGSGFFITSEGYLISNYHVVKDAAKVRIVTSAGTVEAKVIQTDAANDLALLKAEGHFASLPVAPSRKVQLGNTVATVGFPDPGLQGFSPKLAKGEIAALAGAGDDARYFQISVPVQPGNSGGALVDERGNVVGIVSAKLSAKAALASSGSLPENVNYAVKSSFLLSFLESVPDVANKLKDPLTAERKFEDVVKSAQDAAVLVLVY
jgi:TPR repeat protein